ncbi:MAG: guanylate kinase [Flavobacteriales bacterium]|nr:guanylate kinase [Flavobacteriales bacterium]
MTPLHPQGKAIIFSAPSGSGKTTIVQALLREGMPLEFSISATSREPRGAEINGVDYYFLGINGFKQMIDADALLEWEEVYVDQFYGTLKSEIERIGNNGNAVMFDVDVYGGIELKRLLGDQALAVFILPPSVEELERRLRGRNTDPDKKIKLRLAKASEEIEQRDAFDTIIVNEDLDQAIADARAAIIEFLAK